MGTLNLKSPKFMLLGFLALILLSVVGVLAWRFTHFPAFNWDPRAHVSTRGVTVQSVPVVYETVGTLASDHQSTLRPEIDAIVDRILVGEGQPVKAGTPLVQLRQRRQQAELSQAKANVIETDIERDTTELQYIQAEDNLAAAQSRLEQTKADYERYRLLLDKEFVSQQDYDQKKTAYDEAMANYDSAKTQLDIELNKQSQADSNFAEAKAQQQLAWVKVNETLITAPFTGRVGTKYVNVGDYVSSNSDVITVVNDNQLKMNVAVPQRYMAQLSKDTPIKFTSDAYPDQVFEGHVVYISPTIDTDTQTVLVKALINNTSGQLRAGLYGKVQVVLGQRPDALLVPEESLVPLGSQYFVYTVETKDGKPHAKMTQIETGVRVPGMVEIRKGIKAGDEIVTTGLQFVTDGIELAIGDETKKTDKADQKEQK